ncbi:MAG TPA: hypothetical protein VJA16_19325 [Thermoanaerobaculia bacterium]
MGGMLRRRSRGLCAAAALAVVAWVGQGPGTASAAPASAASVAPAAVPAALAEPEALAAPATVEALEARVQELARNNAVVESDLREIEAGFINLLDSQPQEPRLRADLANFYLRWGSVMDGPSPAALRLVSGAPDPIRLACLLHRGAGDLGADLLFAALAQEPGTPDVWLAAAKNARNPAWSIVAFEEAARLLAREAGPDVSLRAAVAVEAAVELDIEYGQFDRAAATLAGLPAAVRAVVESGAVEKVQFQVAGIELEGDLQDLRQGLILLSLARGDMTSADRWLASIPVGQQGSMYRVLAAWRQAPDDPFEVLTSHLETNDEERIRGGRSLALAAVARRDGYPALEARYLRSALSLIGDQAPPAGRRELAPPRIAAAATALEAEIGALRSRLEERLERSVEEAHAALGPDPMAPVVDRLLRTPLLVEFPEHPLPAGVVPLGEGAEDLPASPAKAQVRLPPALDARFLTVRTERRGRRAAVIALPTEDDNSQYQVILSADGGTTWSRPLSTGLKLSRDYVVLEQSNLPLITGNHLYVEVLPREPEDETAAERAAAGTAPAEGQAGRGRAARGIYLDIPLAALERDSDRDGLTDLAEETLVTDPRDPDTDRDGVQDGVDMLPQVAPQRRPGPESQALAAMFAAVESRDRSGGSPDPLLAHTEFWIADRQLFTAVHSRHRLVVLTPDEQNLAEQKFGDRFFARTITLFVLNHAGTQGFVIWTTGNWGGAFYLALESGGWKAYPIQIGGV